MEICYGCGLTIQPLENTIRDEEGNIWHEDCFREPTARYPSARCLFGG